MARRKQKKIRREELVFFYFNYVTNSELLPFCFMKGLDPIKHLNLPIVHFYVLLLSAPVLDCLLGHCGRHYYDEREKDGDGAVGRERAEGDERDDEEEAVGDATELLEERLGKEAGGRVLGGRYRVPWVGEAGAIGTRGGAGGAGVASDGARKSRCGRGPSSGGRGGGGGRCGGNDGELDEGALVGVGGGGTHGRCGE